MSSTPYSGILEKIMGFGVLQSNFFPWSAFSFVQSPLSGAGFPPWNLPQALGGEQGSCCPPQAQPWAVFYLVSLLGVPLHLCPLLAPSTPQITLISEV